MPAQLKHEGKTQSSAQTYIDPTPAYSEVAPKTTAPRASTQPTKEEAYAGLKL
jgi:hypothetical protein